MKKYFLITLIFAATFFANCGNTKNSKDKDSDKDEVVKKDDDKDEDLDLPKDETQKAADDLCDCLSSKAKGFSADFKKLMKKVGESKTPVATYKAELEMLSEEDKTAINEETNKLVEIDNENIQACSKKIVAYKVKGKNEEARQKKILELIAGKTGCEIGSAQWALALEKTYGSLKDDNGMDDDETDKPKKKRTAEEE